jgi:hypothetical protein
VRILIRRGEQAHEAVKVRRQLVAQRRQSSAKTGMGEHEQLRRKH